MDGSEGVNGSSVGIDERFKIRPHLPLEGWGGKQSTKAILKRTDEKQLSTRHRNALTGVQIIVAITSN